MLSFNISGCLGENEDSEGLILATTTSMRDSGLLDVLLSSFIIFSTCYTYVVGVSHHNYNDLISFIFIEWERVCQAPMKEIMSF